MQLIFSIALPWGWRNVDWRNAPAPYVNESADADRDPPCSKEKQTTRGKRYMSTQVHNTAEIGKILLWVAGIVVFIVVALTWVPDWIAPQGKAVQRSLLSL
jgi:hypothetical protein